ncbi:thioredoxin family protein [Heyndrickxia oleronia]|jgi:thioredoxin-like negative regulator of GroEL|uniref:Thioredoxin n=1 Tax=Heyndrickxia oleronia TaxID=38875 RepID=A0A8E2LGB3_9BACI|nr:thioredoxin family protein [Heyndrickxia oleronia]MBU5212050.1 thioredoxin family protein [Heyndrickxia oleronia]MCM3455888.1 thioredoxin family protein [Heyndrickxia oleronia]MEC1376358.1 thioredoxin family protein [Heyndrickxia oleronia]OOP69757.1 thioredoxin [Heyndrickxia oleronia]QQZ06164.1 thioredoxin family protein [Heyndrickxia oleronia]
MEEIKSIETFEEIISGNDPVIIKFYAGWCPDCTRLNMFIDEVIKDYSQYKWYEINRDNFPELAEKYNVMGIPSLLIFQNGEKSAHLHSANAKSPEQVRDFLDSQK